MFGLAGCADESEDGDPLADDGEEDDEEDDGDDEPQGKIPSDASIGGWESFQGRNTNVGGVKGGTGPTEDTAVAWTAETDESVEYPPAVVDGTAFVADEGGTLYAVDAVTGEQQWTFEASDEALSSPVVADETVYVGGQNGTLYAAEATAGEGVWTFETGGEIEPVPTVVDGTGYIGSRDDHLYAVDAVTGDELWSFQAGNWVTSAPAVADGTVYAGGWDNTVYAVDAASGEEQWTFGTAGTVMGPPAVINQRVYVPLDMPDGHVDGGVTALEAGSGEKMWQYRQADVPGGFDAQSPLAVGWNTVFIPGSDGHLHAVNGLNGEREWTYDVGADISQPGIAGGVVYFSTYGIVHGVDSTDGDWVEEYNFSGVGGSAPVVVGDVLYIGLGSSLYALAEA